ncbi:PP2C family protein-serine/threonine phosphatase [Streptomyces sp. B6B3]|uniref:PP2C family protein-serine/threonine phosphatase n=1 Tax=Streptomyces sp. B6B3 TaxID=3153570 RepID=UPI00325C4A73
MDHTARRRAERRRRPLLAAAEPVLRMGRMDVSWLLPALLLVAIPLVDWATSGDFRIITWIVLVPAIAAAVCGVWATTLLAAASAVTYPLVDLTWASDQREGPDDFLLVLVGGGLSVLAAWLRRRALTHLLSVENAAEATRLAVLRPIPQGAGGLESASAYLSADVAARVGGDFFDVQPSPHGPRVLLGDVQGKGTTAVDAAAALLSTFREAGYHEADLTTLAERLELRMNRHNRLAARLGQGDERFATAVLVGFPPGREGRFLDLVNFGHASPLVLGPRGLRSLPEGVGRPLGLSRLADGGVPPVLRVPFEPSETLLLFTDGVTEARDRHGTFLPVADRLTTAASTAPADLVDLVRQAVLAHTGGRLTDDTAILAVRRMPPTQAAHYDAGVTV